MTHFPSRLALLLLAASSLAACATAGPGDPLRPNFPTRLPESPQTAAPPVATAPIPPPPATARPSEAVESRSLAPLAPVRSAPEAAPPAPARTSPAATPPPATKTVTRTSVTGQVVEAEGPAQSYTVQPGDNLDAIARRLGTTRAQLAADNELAEPYVIRPGQVLQGPRAQAKAYVVGSGDTLYAIGRRFGVPAQAIADANEMELSQAIRPGQRLILPDGFRDRGPLQTEVQVAVAPTAPSAPPSAPRQSEPQAQQQTAPPPPPPPAPRPPSATPAAPPAQSRATAPTPAPAAAPPSRSQPASPTPSGPAPLVPSAGPVGDTQITELGRGRFVWPIRGDVISTFGPKGTGQRNDGVNIRARSGATVRAAAEGDVVYAGDQVPGFGNLVLVKHADGWVTAYGHLSRVDVKMQDKVVQGQQLGQAGDTGGVSEPQLHFEVRYAPTPADRARPVDPMLVLPQ